MSGLMSNAGSSVVAGAGLLPLTYHSLAALGTAFQRCNSQKECLSVLPYSENYYLIYEVKDGLLARVSLTVSVLVMLTFTVLRKLLLAAYASAFWWKQVYSNNLGLGHLT
ncbi:LOW QUALITY PROTEIN: membrane-spanning 4-domains subfamily A member 7 [Marmota marmota marmota]|uniref:LOW QUALITY PROTEIN: membrane-spanning 4-domains subfamily A member 7 n=1 Tax=Marmota marmota marmota TaxID=9994 RepID=UPI002092D617|nr:LOW QUALITY PROTEIN: membrane-spanning 4-domains subfamily A member 7 [Marmota marmota marmota]